MLKVCVLQISACEKFATTVLQIVKIHSKGTTATDGTCVKHRSPPYNLCNCNYAVAVIFTYNNNK